MWVLRRVKVPLVACCFVLFVLSLAYRYTNVVDIIFYVTSRDSFSSFYYIPSTPKSGSELLDLPLSLHCNAGRLGNQMCTYATLVGLAALNGRQRFVPLSCNVRHLKDIFVGPSQVQSVDKTLYKKLNPWKLAAYLRPQDAAIPRNSNFLEGYLYPCSYTFFEPARDEIRRQFQFKDHLLRHAQSILRKANNVHGSNVTYVSVHVRRGDYMKRWLEVYEGVPVNEAFFEAAVRHFRERYGRVVFVAVSDDRLWCIRHLAPRFGMYVPEDAPSPAHDLALLASCNHSIVSYGTFGFWGAYLAGGEVLYFDKFLRPNTSFTRENFLFEKMYPPRWKGIVTVNISEIYPPEHGRTVKYQNTTVPSH